MPDDPLAALVEANPIASLDSLSPWGMFTEAIDTFLSEQVQFYVVDGNNPIRSFRVRRILH